MSDRDPDLFEEAFHAAYRRVPETPSTLRHRIRGALGAERPRAVGIWNWLGRPLPFGPAGIRPTPAGVIGLAVAAGVVGVALIYLALPRPNPGSRDVATRLEGPSHAGGQAAASIAPAVTVRFAFESGGGSRVSLVGDFNDWDPAALPMEPAGADRWTASVALSPGRHIYAFVVDGTVWLPDPAAPLAPEDGFGSRNSVVLVGNRPL